MRTPSHSLLYLFLGAAMLAGATAVTAGLFGFTGIAGVSAAVLLLLLLLLPWIREGGGSVTG